MSKKSKAVVFESTPPYGIGMYEDSKARLKHLTLLQDYEELQKETDVTKSKLELAKQRKLILEAEVRFLRSRYKHLVKPKDTNPSHEQNLVLAQNMPKQTKIGKEHLLTRKEASQQRRPPMVPEPNSKKKHRVVKQAVDQSHKKVLCGGKEGKGHSLPLISPPVFDANHKGILHARKEYSAPNTTDRNQKERIIGANDTSLRSSTAAFDLNQDTAPSRNEASLPTRAPIFDLNEISTGDEDFQGSGEAMKFEEAKRSLIRGINEEQQSDLKLSICRNSGESSSRAGKRKISWQDPVALRV